MKRGEQWELRLEAWHREYASTGDAFVVRCHPEARMDKKTGAMFYSTKGPPDFFGVLRGGRAVAFEAKEIKGPRFPFAKLPGHQALALEAVWKAGGLAFVAVRSTSLGHCFFLEWEDIRQLYMEAVAGGSASVALDDFLRLDGRGWLPLCLDAVSARPDADGYADDAGEQHAEQGDDGEEQA